MTVQLTTLDILVKEAHFDPPVARAIGAAIENEIQASQLVTVPILDARFTQFEAKFTQFEAKVDARFVQFESKFDVKLAQLESRLFWKLVGFGLTGLTVAIATLQLFKPTA
jgi:hypothetical protein